MTDGASLRGVNTDYVDDETTKTLLAAVAILGAAVLVTVIAIFLTITVRKSFEPSPNDGEEEY